MSKSALFKPIKVGDYDLEHRVVMPPLTRFRSPNHVPTAHVAEYYRQRTSTPGTLVVTEGVFVSPQAGGFLHVPGIWSQEQVEAWKPAFSQVRQNKSIAFMQLWAIGRQANPDVLKKEGNDYVSASDIPMASSPDVKPRALTRTEIKQYVRDYANAGINAIKAGAHGVEIHSANGYLFEQFLHENSNNRTDEYGGSIENRARFVLEVVDALIEAIGASKVGIRLSPWNAYGDVDPGVSPIPQWSYLVMELEKRARDGNRLAYIHLVDPTAFYNDDQGSNEFIRVTWKGPLIRCGSLIDVAEKIADSDDQTLVAIGRLFISNPDLPHRMKHGYKLTKYDRSTFYTQGTKGYIDYEMYEQAKL